MKKSIQHRIIPVAAAILLAALPSCHTMNGVGKDVKTAGEGIQKAANQ